MAVEYPVTINEFNEAWPDGLDSKSQGDDHIRNIKGALKRTFPNVKGPTEVSHKDLDKLIKPGVTNTPGMIMMWAFGAETVPGGWKICNGVGAISDGRPVPNLTDRFIVGAGSGYGPGWMGGSGWVTPTGWVAGTAITEAQMPSHNHDIHFQNTPTTEYRPGIGAAELQSGYPNTVLTQVNSSRIKYKGGSQAHTHGLTLNTFDNRPPFYALLFIIKD